MNNLDVDDDDDENDFNISVKAKTGPSKLSSLFKSVGLIGEGNKNDSSLKYKAPVQPKQSNATPASSSSGTLEASSQQQSPIFFYKIVNVFKHQNNQYAPHGKQGLALISAGNHYKLLIYINKSAATVQFKLTSEFNVSLQANNYLSFHDDQQQLWMLLFDSEDLVAEFVSQLLVIKFNLTNPSNINESFLMQQDLKYNDQRDATIEVDDSIEIATMIRVWSNKRLDETPVENRQEKPFRLKLGKNKLPKLIETQLIDSASKQGDRRLFVLKGSAFGDSYQQKINADLIYFVDINVLRVKKNTKGVAANSNVENSLPSLPTLSTDNQPVGDSNNNNKEPINIGKKELKSRMAKVGQPLMITNTLGEENRESSNQQQQQQAKVQASKQQFAASLDSLDPNVIAANILIQQQQQLQLQQQSLHLSPVQASFYAQQQAPFVKALPSQAANIADVSSNGQLFDKLDAIMKKLDELKSMQQENPSHADANSKRVEKENAQLRSDLLEKSSKIDELNNKMKEKEALVDRQLEKAKRNEERSLVENAELQARIEKASLTFKVEKQARKQAEQLVAEREEEIDELKATLSQVQYDNKKRNAAKAKSNESNEESKLAEEKYERLQQKALAMKEKYETRIEELTAQADLQGEKAKELAAAQVKKLMNSIFKRLKQQIDTSKLYQGQGILVAVLKLIRYFTAKVLEQDEELDENDDDDQDENYFAEFKHE